MDGNAARWLPIAVLLLTSCRDLFPADPPGQGPLRFPAPVQRVTADIGGRTVELRFPFVNSGAAPIAIDAISASCPCLQVVSGRGTYAPGESGCVVVSMEVSGQASTQRGVVRVSAGAAGSRPTDLTAIVEIPPLLVFAPTVLLWSRAADGAAAETKTMTAAIAPGSDYEIAAIRLASPRFSCTSAIAVDRRTAVISVTPDGAGRAIAGTLDVTIVSRRAPGDGIVLHAYAVVCDE